MKRPWSRRTLTSFVKKRERARRRDAHEEGAPLRVRFSDAVFGAVARVPRGRVASYGTIARLAGFPGAARQVGMVLRNGRGIPWWRIVNREGRVVIGTPELRMDQIQRLGAERVRVDEEGQVVEWARLEWRGDG